MPKFQFLAWRVPVPVLLVKGQASTRASGSGLEGACPVHSTHTIRELHTARRGRFLGVSFPPVIEFVLSRDMVHLKDYLLKNNAGYGARTVSVITERLLTNH